VLAGLVFLFGAWVALSLSSGQLDPIGSPYYGVVVSWRESVLFALLGALQVVALVDAGALARRRRAWSWWLGLAAGALLLPFVLVVGIARLDVWRAEHRGAWANGLSGCLMLLLLGSAYLARRRAWAPRTKTP